MTTVQPGSAPHGTSAPDQRDLPPDAWMPIPARLTDRTAEYLSALVLSKVKHIRLTREDLMHAIATADGDDSQVLGIIVARFATEATG
jgi:hypothetical protein